MTVEYEGERISYSYLPPRSPEELALKRRNIEFWSQQTFGQMGRYPDFARSSSWACSIGRTSSRRRTQNGPKTPEPIIDTRAATISV